MDMLDLNKKLRSATMSASTNKTAEASGALEPSCRETAAHALTIVRDGVIRHVFYPVFPPDADATNVVAWLRANGGGGAGV